VEDYGRFEAYSNRDSLKYRSVYGLDDVLTYTEERSAVGFRLEYVCSTGNDICMEDSENMRSQFVNCSSTRQIPN
jgi:hypothetical protein